MIQLAYRLRRWLLAALRWPTRGVKVAAFDDIGRILLIRNRYGRTDLWVLPGGGVGWRENFADAAARELREETGLMTHTLEFFARYESSAEGKRDVIELFTAHTAGEPIADRSELIAAQFFLPAALPDGVSPATLRRIAELQGDVPAAPGW